MADITGIGGGTNTQVTAAPGPEEALKKQHSADGTGAPKITENSKVGSSDSDGATSEKVEKLTTELDALLSTINTSLKIEVSDDLEDIVVKVIDKETDKVIKQIPSEDMLRITKKIEEVLSRYPGTEERSVTVFVD